MDYSGLNFQRFPAYRDGVRRMMAEKSLAEIRAFRSMLYKLKEMSPNQIQLLIDDNKLMEDYRLTHEWQTKDWFIDFMEKEWPKTA